MGHLHPKGQKFLFSGNKDASYLFLQGGVFAGLWGLQIMSFYSLVAKINSTLIHGVIVGSCPGLDLAQWSGLDRCHA